MITKGKSQLEKLAENNLGIKLKLDKLRELFQLCDKCKIIWFPIQRKIYYYCDELFCKECPKYEIPGEGYFKVLAVYESNNLIIYKNKEQIKKN
ncbi:MAG: hypothetical protein ACPLXC_00345 [Candidatus Pacearchaeota archaeon]